MQSGWGPSGGAGGDRKLAATVEIVLSVLRQHPQARASEHTVVCALWVVAHTASTHARRLAARRRAVGVDNAHKHVAAAAAAALRRV